MARRPPRSETETLLPDDQQAMPDLFNSDGTPRYRQQYDLPGRPLWRSFGGSEYSMERAEGGGLLIHGVQDVHDILEFNKRQLTENSGYNWDKSMKRCASIPHALRMKWLIEEGWDAWNPDHDDALTRKLNDPDYRHLRTASGRV